MCLSFLERIRMLRCEQLPASRLCLERLTHWSWWPTRLIIRCQWTIWYLLSPLPGTIMLRARPEEVIEVQMMQQEMGTTLSGKRRGLGTMGQITATITRWMVGSLSDRRCSATILVDHRQSTAIKKNERRVWRQRDRRDWDSNRTQNMSSAEVDVYYYYKILSLVCYYDTSNWTFQMSGCVCCWVLTTTILLLLWWFIISYW